MNPRENTISEQLDEQLMELYQQGGESGERAFKELYRRYAGRIYGYLRKHLGHEANVDEVFQQTMMQFHQSRERYNKQHQLAPWLFTICRNSMIDYIRKSKRRQETDLPEDLISDNSDATKSSTTIPMTTLSKQQKMAIDMRYNQDLEFEEIAKKLNISQANSRQVISRAIRRLRSKMKGNPS